ncbi:MAG TPA: hypothetical protein VMT00_09680 [Thermoanaerobaculia bacterium]|nr:hypothetical protein [Thermoanaerobaculia bacterium]
MGRRDDADAVLQGLLSRRSERYTSAYGIAIVAAGLGDRDATFSWLDAAYEERAAWLSTSFVDPRWNSWRDAPRFRELMRRMEFAGA